MINSFLIYITICRFKNCNNCSATYALGLMNKCIECNTYATLVSPSIVNIFNCQMSGEAKGFGILSEICMWHPFATTGKMHYSVRRASYKERYFWQNSLLLDKRKKLFSFFLANLSSTYTVLGKWYTAIWNKVMGTCY